MKLGAAIEEFVSYKQAIGYSYKWESNCLKAFLRKTGDVELRDLSVQHAQAFLPIEETGLVTGGWFSKYGTLHRFFRFAIVHGYMQHRILPTSLPELPPAFVPYIYSLADMRRLLGVPDSHYGPSSPLSPYTMRTLLLLLYGTGLRVGEALKLTLENVDLRNAVLTVRETKFLKSRLVPVGHDLLKILHLYWRRKRLDSVHEPDMSFLRTRRDTPVTHDHVDHEFEQLRMDAGVLRFDNARYQPRLHDFRQNAEFRKMPNHTLESAGSDWNGST